MQKNKILIDTGEEGVEGTGDTLYQGGTSINTNLNSIYNVFGDYRLFRGDAGQGNQVMILHPSGYYQKHSRAYYAGSENPSGNPIEYGSLHDLSVIRDGAGDLIVTLPVGNGHAGESIQFINTDGSIGVGTGKEVTIRCSGSGDSIGNLGNTMKIQQSYFKITLWIDTSSPTGSHWSYKIESLFGDTSTPYEIVISNIGSGETKDIGLFTKARNNAVKHIMFVSQRGTNIQQEASEVMILVNNSNNNDNNVYSTEYARIRTSSTPNSKDNLLYETEYRIVNGVVRAYVKNIGSTAIDVYFKAIESIGSR